MSKNTAKLDWLKNCYGIDLQGENIVVVRAERVRGKIHITRTESSSATFKRAAEEGIPVVAALSSASSFTRCLEAPYSSKNKAARVFPTLLDIQLPFPLEDCIYELINTRSTPEGKTSTLAAAARSVNIEQHLKKYETLSLDPVILDQEGLALWTQSLAEEPADSDANIRAVLYIGVERITLALGEGNEFVSTHNINPDNTAQLKRLLQARNQQTESDRAKNVSWFIAGPGAGDPAMVQDILNNAEEGSVSNYRIHREPETFLARALAERALTAGPLRCNLRAGRFAHELTEARLAKQNSMAAVLCLAAGLLLCIANITNTMLFDYKNNKADRVFMELRDELVGHKNLRGAKGKKAIDSVKTQLAAKKAGYAAFHAVYQPSLLEHIGNIIQTGRKQGLQFDRLLINRADAIISGTADEWTHCDALKSILDNAGYNVTVDRGEALANERIPFTIKTLKESGNE